MSLNFSKYKGYNVTFGCLAGTKVEGSGEEIQALKPVLACCWKCVGHRQKVKLEPCSHSHQEDSEIL